MASHYGVHAMFCCLCGYEENTPDLLTAKEARARHFRAKPRCKERMKGEGYRV